MLKFPHGIQGIHGVTLTFDGEALLPLEGRSGIAHRPLVTVRNTYTECEGWRQGRGSLRLGFEG